MPPQRTSLQRAPPKLVKSERTHEENQERAYIAASRRSDRSLEARVESARRASEIHKRRTGRALRVTESDVLNEEMYEEEDDDMANSYRNLGLLISGGTPIDHRFAAYYQHQMQMRNFVDRALNNRLARPGQVVDFPQQPGYPAGFLPLSTHGRPPAAYFGSPYYRQQPYQVPGQSHGRSMSMHVPMSYSMGGPIQTGSPCGTSPSPSFSLPGTPVQAGAGLHKRHLSVPATAHSVGNAPVMSTIGDQNHGYHTPVTVTKLTPTANSHESQSPTSGDGANRSMYNPAFPFTTELPAESARFFAGQLESPGGMVSPSQYDISALLPHSDKGLQNATSTPILINKVNDVLPHPTTTTTTATTTTSSREEPSWQHKSDVTPGEASPTDTIESVQTPIGDPINQLFEGSGLSLPDNSGQLQPCNADGVTESLFGEVFGQDSWDAYVNQDWLDVCANPSM